MSDHEDTPAQMQGDSAHASGNDSQGGAEGKHRATVSSLQAQAEQTTLAVRTLAEAVQEIRKDMKSLKRKKEEEDGVPAKKTCSGGNPIIPSVQKPGSSREDDQSSDLSEQQTGKILTQMRTWMTLWRKQMTMIARNWTA